MRRRVLAASAALGRGLLQADVVPDAGSSGPDCSPEAAGACFDPAAAQRWAIGALFLILGSSALGVLLPLLSRRVKALRPGSFPFTAARCFGGGVVIATGLIHVFPEGIELLGNECLGWPDYPWGAMIATAAAIIVAIIEFSAGQLLFSRARSRMTQTSMDAALPDAPETGPEDSASEEAEKGVDATSVDSGDAQMWARCRAVAVAQVLEYGIAAHSVIIGIALGVSSSPCTIRPLAAALVFHQMFEGLALGATLIGAGYHGLTYLCMAALFAVTTPLGVAVGIGIRTTYNANSATALGVQGTFESVAAGILIYMGLVDLMATDIFSQHMRSQRTQYQAGCLAALFLGAAGMAVIAIWA